MIRTSTLLSLAFTLLVACGGGGAAAPKALQWHYDEVYIAQFSLEEKSTVLQAQNDYQRARAENMKAEADYKESATKLNVAKNEREQALLAERSANTEKKAADDSGDMNRVNSAMKDVRSAELTRRAADEKVGAIKAERKFLNEWVRYTAEEMYNKEAQYEYAKARLGQAKNIAPKGVKYERYKTQLDERSRRAQRARHKAEELRQKAQEKEKAWKGRLNEANRARGIPTESPKPSVPNTPPTNSTTTPDKSTTPEAGGSQGTGGDTTSGGE